MHCAKSQNKQEGMNKKWNQNLSNDFWTTPPRDDNSYRLARL